MSLTGPGRAGSDLSNIFPIVIKVGILLCRVEDGSLKRCDAIDIGKIGRAEQSTTTDDKVTRHVFFAPVFMFDDQPPLRCRLIPVRLHHFAFTTSRLNFIVSLMPYTLATCLRYSRILPPVGKYSFHL